MFSAMATTMRRIRVESGGEDEQHETEGKVRSRTSFLMVSLKTSGQCSRQSGPDHAAMQTNQHTPESPTHSAADAAAALAAATIVCRCFSGRDVKCRQSERAKSFAVWQGKLGSVE